MTPLGANALPATKKAATTHSATARPACWLIVLCGHFVVVHKKCVTYIKHLHARELNKQCYTNSKRSNLKLAYAMFPYVECITNFIFVVETAITMSRYSTRYSNLARPWRAV